MLRSAELRRLRASTPVRAALAVAVVLLLLLRWRSTPRLSFNNQQLEALWAAPKDEAAELYETTRQKLLEKHRYEPHTAARAVGCAPWTAEGYATLESRADVYASRLGRFVFRFLDQAPMRNRLDHAIGRVLKQVPPTVAVFPRNFYSTHRLGYAGVPDMFRLWPALLPLPLGGHLDDLVPQTDWADPARRGAVWSVMIADASDTTTELSTWIGDSVTIGNSAWSQVWRKVPSAAHRSRIFQYMALLFEGGLVATTDTVPVAHPYLWGLGAKPALNPDLEVIRNVLKKHASSSDSTHRRLWERSVSDTNWTGPVNVWEQLPYDVPAKQTKETWEPRYPSNKRLARRAPSFFGHPSQPDEATSILSPEINLVVAIDWDSSLAFKSSHWAQWSLSRLFRSLKSGPGRTLQFSSNIIAAKPYHLVLIDTVATIWGQIEAGDLEKLDPVDISGAGPFTDSVLRYLLVRYGVAPKDLRGLPGPVRVGDVLILQEGAFLAPPSTKSAFLSYLREFFPMLPGSGVAKAVPGKTLWYWGTGFRRWWTRGRQVASQGLDPNDETTTPP